MKVKVTPDELKQAAGQLSGVAAKLDDASKWAPGIDAVENPGIEAELEAFLASSALWVAGVQELVTELKTRLTAAASKYESTEQSIATAAAGVPGVKTAGKLASGANKLTDGASGSKSFGSTTTASTSGAKTWPVGMSGGGGKHAKGGTSGGGT